LAAQILGYVGIGIITPLVIMTWVGLKFAPSYAWAFILAGLGIGMYNVGDWLRREAKRK